MKTELKELKSIEYYKQLREICGLSQQNLAELCGVSRQTIAAWETNKWKPSKRFLLVVDYILNDYYNKHKKEIEERYEHYMEIIKNM